jgi:hypothetical protein
VKCHAKLGGREGGAGSLVMLKQVLLKWLPNAVYEYPEELFRDVMGVDENAQRANWHRATVVCCANCRAEIAALKTIPTRTQLAPWLASVSVGVEVAPPKLDDLQVLSGTKQTGVVVPAPAVMPSLLPYLARAPMLHSSGSGHAAQLVPEVAYVARKNNSLMELTGVQGASAGLAIDPTNEVRANAARAARMQSNTWGLNGGTGEARPALATASAPPLGMSLQAPNLARSAQEHHSGFIPQARPTMNQRGLFVMESSYMDTSGLNPHQHPTHQAHVSPPPVSTGKTGPLLLAGSKSVASLLSPNTATIASNASTRRMLHSGSVGTLVSKSVVAGGAGTAPALPHRPLAPTVLFASPVKGGASGSPNGSASKSTTAAATRTGSATKLPTLSSSPPPTTTTTKRPKAKPSAAKPAAAGAAKGKNKGKANGSKTADADEYADDSYAMDEFGSTADVGAAAAAAGTAGGATETNGYTWNDDTQQWIDANGVPAAATQEYDAAATAAYWAAQGYDTTAVAATAPAAAAPLAAPAAAAAPPEVDEEDNYDDDF